MEKRLAGMTAIVTGSGQGVGRGIAIALAREGARVITNNRKPGSESCSRYRKEDMTPAEYDRMLSLRGDAESTAELIRMEGGEAAPFYGDVSNFETAREMVQFAVDTYGRLDILVNNAAGLGQGTIQETSEADWDSLTLAKLKGAFNMMHHAIPVMLRQGFGRILNCASDAWTGTANLSAYSAANAGVVGLTKAVAQELAQVDITVNAYCPQADSPGHVVEFNKTIRSLKTAVNPEKMKAVEADHGDPIHAAPFLVYLCTREAGDISGSVFVVRSSGKIGIYSDPVLVKQIQKSDGIWTLNELEPAVRSQLLADYQSPARADKWRK